jgi:hypothetical protein
MEKTDLKSIVIMLLILFPIAVSAQDNLGLNYGENIGLGNTDPITIVVNLIKLAFSFLALIFTIMLLLGGLKWMTAGGNDEKAADAKKTIANGIIGVAIMLLSWSIASWVIQNAVNLTTK